MVSGNEQVGRDLPHGHTSSEAAAPAGSFLTVQAFARRTGLSVKSVWRRIRDGSVPVYQPGGRGTSVRIPGYALEVGGLGQSRAERTDAQRREAPNPKRRPGPQAKWRRPVDLAQSR